MELAKTQGREALAHTYWVGAQCVRPLEAKNRKSEASSKWLGAAERLLLELPSAEGLSQAVVRDQALLEWDSFRRGFGSQEKISLATQRLTDSLSRAKDRSDVALGHEVLARLHISAGSFDSADQNLTVSEEHGGNDSSMQQTKILVSRARLAIATNAPACSYLESATAICTRFGYDHYLTEIELAREGR